MVKIIENPDTNHLTESFQANDLKFSFAKLDKDGHYHMQHVWVKCREYFNEILMKNHHPDDFAYEEVYGLKYNYDKFPLEMNETCFAVKFQNQEVKQTFLDNLEFIHKIEDLHKIEHTKIQAEFDGRDDVVVLHSSKFWMQKCVLFNVYSLLIKLCSLGANEKSWKQLEVIGNKLAQFPSELEYIRTLQEENFVRIIHGLTEICNVPTKYVDGSSEIRQRYNVHVQSGILTLWSYFKQGSKYYEPALKELIAKFADIMTNKADFPTKIFGVR